ncbi:ras-related protein Rab-38-like [Xenia sp. Carnegie-2017]|uniref:ras-related protein Rab-38-like n=1 Tax=Xenia sp. Carnegie-2017 TaxID=2897299 RepID=UPI001F043888|nr:ras-related protein Rab-38-like [Xenia sp. Carnegie-2017]
MNLSVHQKKEKTFKILVLGDVGTGKTSFIRQYVSQKFFINYKATIGSDFAIKDLDWDENLRIKLQLWDIAGQERFSCMTRVYYRGAVGAFVVFDVSRAATFEGVEKWKEDLDSKLLLPTGEPIPAILLCNKCDQSSIIKKGKIEKLCHDLGFVSCHETSAKDNVGIDEAIKVLISKILQTEESLLTTLSGVHVPIQEEPKKNSTNCCACHLPRSKKET